MYYKMQVCVVIRENPYASVGEVVKVLKIFPNSITFKSITNPQGYSFTVSGSFSTLKDTFLPSPHMSNFRSIDDYGDKLFDGADIPFQTFYNTGSYKKGEKFRTCGEYNPCSLKVKLKQPNRERGYFYIWNLIPAHVNLNTWPYSLIQNNQSQQGEKQMQTIPNKKFFMVARENANSGRKVFEAESNSKKDVQKAYDEAHAHAVNLIRQGDTGVVILEAAEVIRPKTEYESTKFE